MPVYISGETYIHYALVIWHKTAVVAWVHRLLSSRVGGTLRLSHSTPVFYINSHLSISSLLPTLDQTSSRNPKCKRLSFCRNKHTSGWQHAHNNNHNNNKQCRVSFNLTISIWINLLTTKSYWLLSRIVNLKHEIVTFYLWYKRIICFIWRQAFNGLPQPFCIVYITYILYMQQSAVSSFSFSSHFCTFH